MSRSDASVISHFKIPLALTFVGLIAAYVAGYLTSGTVSGGLSAIFLCAVLSILEISLSFDNAIVNASVLGRMSPVWRRRFLTWGILIAVFGMRLIFPLLLVSIMTKLGPWQALMLAIGQPDQYAAVMEKAHGPVSAFGGSFLLMVAFKHFFNPDRRIFWLSYVERPLAKIGRLGSSELAIAILILWAISTSLPPENVLSFLVAGLFGLVTFIVVDGASTLLDRDDEGSVTPGAEQNHRRIHRASFGLFIYLEVLDASFSFDGVVGAFAITTSLILITIGLSVGALFVRSLTILLVERGTLGEYRFLEHGAFWAIGALAVIMFINPFFRVPEILTGCIGAAFIGLSFWSSVRYNGRQAEREHS